MIEAVAVCAIVEETGELICTMSMASVSAVLFLAIMGIAFQTWRLVEDWQSDKRN